MIVFYHIPKTAGVSFTRAAAEAIPGIHRRVLLTQMREWLGGLDARGGEMQDVAFLAGHFAYGVHPRLPGEHRTLTFLRHPIEQTVSMQCEAMKRPDIYPHGELRRLLTGGAGVPYFGNAQVRHLASEDGRPVTGPLRSRHLERARRVVTHELSCFGITEYFAASLALIDECLGTRMTTRQANVSSRAPVRDLDPELFLEIWNANELDRELYDHCLSVFVERLRAARMAPAADLPVMKAMSA